MKISFEDFTKKIEETIDKSKEKTFELIDEVLDSGINQGIIIGSTMVAGMVGAVAMTNELSPSLALLSSMGITIAIGGITYKVIDEVEYHKLSKKAKKNRTTMDLIR